jgi:hypothetical protein
MEKLTLDWLSTAVGWKMTPPPAVTDIVDAELVYEYVRNEPTPVAVTKKTSVPIVNVPLTTGPGCVGAKLRVKLSGTLGASVNGTAGDPVMERPWPLTARAEICPLPVPLFRTETVTLDVWPIGVFPMGIVPPGDTVVDAVALAHV